MKKLLLILLVTPLLTNAQKQEGKVIYQVSRKLDFKMEDSDHDQIRAMLPKTNKSFRQLLFNGDQSIYKKYESLQENTDQPMHFTSEGGATIKIQMSQPDNRIIRDLSSQLVTQKIEFMGKNFLIEDEDRNVSWKITGEQKEILNYQCMKAVWEDSTASVTAWFAPEIKVSSGPMYYGNLPGLILALELNNGETQIEATEVIFEAISNAEFQLPKKLKKVSREEFEAIEAEKMKEMEELYGGQGGGVRIIKRSN